MATYTIDKIKYSNNTYNLIDSGAIHNSSGILTGTTSNFKSNGTIVAEEGIFNKLIATSANISTLDVDSLTAQNATVVGLLDVQGQLKTNTWTNSNIATIEGNFFIAPTIVSKSTSLTKYQLKIQDQTSTNSGISSITGQTKRGWVLTISGNFNLNQVGADLVNGESSTNLNQWSQGSKVLITGDIEKTDGVYPLGTLTGFIYSSTTSSDSTLGSITIYNVTDNLGNTDIFTILGANTYNYREVKVSLTQRYYGGLRPIGILMSAQGRSSKSFIDIYGGANALQSETISGASSDFGGLAIPNVRIGNLRGLPNIRTDDFTNDKALPKGWGIYTDNGYFKGTIVSTYGEIGGFAIGDTAINTNNKASISDSTTGIRIDSVNGIGFSGVTYFNTSGTGKIGPWILTANEIYNGKAGGIGATTTTAGVYLGINGLNISNGTADTTSYITKTEVNIGNKLTWKNKVLTVNGSIIANYLRIESEAEIVDVDGVISNEVVSNELEDSINGLFYYQYTVTSGGKTTVYNVSYDEERSGSPYFYIDENGNEHTVTEADLDRENGELIYHRVGGITDQLENVNQNIQITNAGISAINERIDSVDNTANTNQATLGTLITDVNSINKTVSDVQADIQEVEGNISSLKSVVEILDDRIIIHSGDSSIELTDKQITLMGNESGSVATITSDAINIAKTNIIEQYTGNLKWTGRTDGHLTLQRIN